jgi:ketosteroid isomerase-like protein
MAALCGVVLGACQARVPEQSAQSEPTVDTAAEADTIMQLENEWSSRLQAKDIDWIMNLHAADARQFPPNAAPVVGQDSLRAAWETLANTPGLRISWQPTAAHVSSAGDMAYDYGTASLTYPDGRTENAKYVVVWVREDDRWKVALDMFSPNALPVE